MLLAALIAFWSAVATPRFDYSVLTIPTVKAAPLTIQDLHALASSTAEHASLNVDHFMKTIDCETRGTWDPNIQSDASSTDPGGRELSFGLAQIHLPAHPTITYQEAIDPYFALQWMAGEWQANRQWEWTCWRKLYGN